MGLLRPARFTCENFCLCGPICVGKHCHVFTKKRTTDFLKIQIVTNDIIYERKCILKFWSIKNRFFFWTGRTWISKHSNHWTTETSARERIRTSLHGSSADSTLTRKSRNSAKSPSPSKNLCFYELIARVT